MKIRLTLTLFLMLVALSIQAQDSNFQLFHSLEASLELGSGGGEYGLQIKANHHWLESSQFIVSSGLAFSSFWGSESSDEGSSETRGFTTDNHLRLYSGASLSFLKKFYVGVEAYLGAYHAYTKGTLKNASFDIDRSYDSSEFLFDYGSRLSLGYQLNQRLGLQLTLNNSWRQADSGLGTLAGLFAGEPDGKMSFGAGINYRLR